MVIYYMYSLAIIPFFMSRAMIPIFATALVARFGPEWGFLADYAGIQLVSDLPHWMTSNFSLGILGVAALIELGMQKSADFREFLNMGDPALKGIVAFVLCFNLVEGDFNELLTIIKEDGIGTDYAWGHSFAYTWSFAIGWATFFASKLRAIVFGSVIEMDQEDDLGMQGFASWVEDGVGFTGPMFAMIFPAVALVTAGATLLGLYLFKRYLGYRENKKKTPCSACGHDMHLCALACPKCQTPPGHVHKVGMLGIIKQDLATDLQAHRHDLIAHKRCGSCGERLSDRSVVQQCPACGTAPFANRQELEAYVDKVSVNMPTTLGISMILSFIPILGLIPGIIYYKVNLISSLRCYIPRTTGCLTRWVTRIFNIILICLQPVPFLGMFTLPLMAWTSFIVYRGALRREGAKMPPNVPGAAFAS